MATLTGKDLDIKDLNARLQAICLKMGPKEEIKLGNFKVSQEKFQARRKELTQDTISMILPHIFGIGPNDLWGNRSKLFAYMLPILDGTQLRQLFKQLFKQNIHLYSNKNYSDTLKLKPFKGPVDSDPEWNTIYARSIDMGRRLRAYMLKCLDTGDAIRHLTRYPEDIDLVPLDAAGVAKLTQIIEEGKHKQDVVDSLCNNESEALLPVYMKLINEGCLNYMGPQLNVIPRLHAAGYPLTFAAAAPGTCRCTAADVVNSSTVQDDKT